MKDAKAVTRLINEWRINFCNTELQSLRSLESGLLASEKLV